MEVDPIDGLSSVELAARSGCVEMLEILVAAGAPLEPSGVYAPMVGAAASLNPQAVAFLLDEGVDPNRTAADHPEATGETALHTAAYFGQTATMDLLIDAGAEVDATNNLDETPLHFAVYASQWEAAAKLLQNGASPTPEMLIAAVRDRDLEAVQMLVGAGVDPTEEGAGGESGLEAAQAEGFPEIISYLQGVESS